MPPYRHTQIGYLTIFTLGIASLLIMYRMFERADGIAMHQVVALAILLVCLLTYLSITIEIRDGFLSSRVIDEYDREDRRGKGLQPRQPVAVNPIPPENQEPLCLAHPGHGGHIRRRGAGETYEVNSHEKDRERPQGPCPDRIPGGGIPQIEGNPHGKNEEFHHHRSGQRFPEVETHANLAPGGKLQVRTMHDQVEKPVADHQ